MAQVTVSVGGRNYALACAAGEEDRLKEMAAYVDAKLDFLTGKLGRLSEGRALLMAAIMITDELQDARSGIATSGPMMGLDEETVATIINEVATDLEALTTEPHARD